MSDEHPLTKEQQHAVDEFRYRMNNWMIAEIHRFTRQHTDLQVAWNFTLDATRRTVFCAHCRYEHEIPECH